jgi:hypothetical protein
MKYTKHLLIAGLSLCLSVLTAHAKLLTDGVGVLDTDFNIVWTQDANLLNTMEGTTTTSYTNLVNAVNAANNGVVEDSPNYFDGHSYEHVLTASDFGPGGTADYWGAIAFVKYLNSINYGGSHSWALPSIGCDASLGYDQTGNVFGELYYTELGAAAGSTMPSGPFINVQVTGFTGNYWFGSEYGPNANFAWYFSTNYGFQFFSQKRYYNYVWPVSPGSVRRCTK